LDKVATQLGSPLPQSYREFMMKRFGPGVLNDGIYLYSFLGRRMHAPTLIGKTKLLRGFGWPAQANPCWLSSLVFFGEDINGWYVWDPATRHQGSNECRCYLVRHHEETPSAAGNSIWEFVKSASANIEVPSNFAPDYMRTKKKPGKREVKRWLEWKGDTVFKVASLIRDQNEWTGLPVLADALEEAGCQHADILNSCRQGVPEVDGPWVIEQLLDR
jgi:hypothetical protein